MVNEGMTEISYKQFVGNFLQPTCKNDMCHLSM